MKETLPDKSLVYLFKFASNSFTNIGDTSNAEKVLKLSRLVRNKFAQHPLLNNDEKALLDYIFSSIEYYYEEEIKKNYTNCYQKIVLLEHNLNNNSAISQEWRGMINDNIRILKAHYFLITKNNDSALVYIGKDRASSSMSASSKINHYESLSLLYENQGRYKDAFFELKKAKNLLDTLHKARTLELNDLLYAYAEAEHNKTELAKSEEVSKKRRVLISVLIVVALSIISFVIILMRIKDKSSKKRIENLNKAANLQIAEMEEIKILAIDEEKKKMGMDLHDSLASSFAGVKNKIESLIHDVKEDEIKTDLWEIKKHIDDAYANVRNKSHLLYEEGGHEAGIQFEKRINKFIAAALPDKLYTTEVLIDEGTLEHFTIDDKIEILKIIQETITNIIKHAKASKVSVLIYEDHNQILLNIQDNGIGFKAKNSSDEKQGMGLHSIKNRAKNLGGQVDIISDKNGTEINIRIPSKNL